MTGRGVTLNNHQLHSLGAVVFEDRTDAGRRLTTLLAREELDRPVVCGVARGGVPVAAEVATALDAPLDVLTVKKLRSPFEPGLAVGAICADGTLALRSGVISALGVSAEYMRDEIAVRHRDAQDAEAEFRSGMSPMSLVGQTVVLVDDGVATGSTLRAAVRSVSARGAARVIVAVPFGSDRACSEIASAVDEVLRGARPSEFWAVGQFYGDFSPVSESEIARLVAAREEDGVPHRLANQNV